MESFPFQGKKQTPKMPGKFEKHHLKERMTSEGQTKLTKDNEGIVTQNKVLMSLHAWFSGLRIFLQSTGNQGSDLTNNRNPSVCIF